MSDQPSPRPKIADLLIVAVALIFIIALVALGAWQGGMRSVAL